MFFNHKFIQSGNLFSSNNEIELPPKPLPLDRDECRLVSVNPKYPFLEPTLSGPLLWPEPERYLIDKNHHPYHIRTPINFELISHYGNHDNKGKKWQKCDIIEYNLNKYRYLINSMIERSTSVANSTQTCQSSASEAAINERRFLNKIQIHIARIDCDQYPEFIETSKNQEESYEIKVEPDNGEAGITSQTIWGMIRALETFSQLFYVDRENCAVVIDVVKVWDRPRFRYRSIMIDTARHYLPLWIE
ncbi:hypothetical protein BLA29_000523 [Euroglyphus maynei]|uniref:Beta-hexosaminidase eukaryotic type N-terminal domain-containing protein n=1 Tax=Euroglyphus maynei TaxID=6958 RepID=A0A1Y3BEP7_EURMA|nr:hypothetical protein BLA29_000523 [Euroglyphus maynei]